MSHAVEFVSTQLSLRRARNVRDLGGYPFTDEAGRAGTTAFGVFLRGAALGGLRSSGRAMLRSYGLARVIDLRSAFELRHWPDPFHRRPEPGVAYVSVPMLDQLNSNGLTGPFPERMHDVYRDLLEHDGASIAAVMRALDGPGCALFHCRAGKDRTGVIAMLLLGLAGVDDAHIVADYEATNRFMGRLLAAQRLGVTILLRRSVPRCLFEAAPIEMERTLAFLHERFGSARAYLAGHAGCEPDLLDRLAGRLRGAARD